MEVGGPARPMLIVVSGAPGSGKTTLARLLGDRLHLPVISRDTIKTGLHVTHRSIDPGETHRFSTAAFETFYDVVRVLTGAGVSLVAEAAFHAERSAAELAAVSAGTALVAVHCQVDPALAAARYRSRAERGERHPAHADLVFADHMDAAGFDWRRYDAPRLDAAPLTVDTTDGYLPSLDEIVRHIGRRLEAAS